MIRRRMLLLAAVASILSIVVTWAAYRMLKNQVVGNAENRQVVVAAKKLTVGARLGADDVRLMEWPRAALPEGSFSKKNDVIGRGVVMPLVPGEPVLQSKLAPQDGRAGFPAAIPEGMRAVAVKVDEVIGVAGFVLPGTRVDVILSGLPERRSENEVSRMFLENVLVFAVGQNAEQDTSGKPQTAQVITVLVTPEDAQKLALASADGNRIHLALRNPLDVERKDPVPVLREELFRQTASRPWYGSRSGFQNRGRYLARVDDSPPEPAAEPPPPTPPPPPKVTSIEVFEGLKKELVTFGPK